MPAAAVIPASLAYANAVAVKKLVVYQWQGGVSYRPWFGDRLAELWVSLWKHPLLDVKAPSQVPPAHPDSPDGYRELIKVFKAVVVHRTYG